MKITPAELPGVFVIEPRIFADSRGHFLETWNLQAYERAGFPAHMVQDNMSWSKAGVVRGLHYQHPNPQGKLVQVLAGEVFDVAVDIRRGSPTFGKWQGFRLSGENRHQVYIPVGYAHGFCVLSDALLSYKCTDFYRPDCDASILWNDPEIGIEWPVSSGMLSPKDEAAPRLSQVPEHRLPTFAG